MIRIGVVGDCEGCGDQIMMVFEDQADDFEVYMADHFTTVPFLNERNINYYIFETAARINEVMNNVQLVFLVNPDEEMSNKVGSLAVEKNIPIMLCNFLTI